MVCVLSLEKDYLLPEFMCWDAMHTGKKKSVVIFLE